MPRNNVHCRRGSGRRQGKRVPLVRRRTAHQLLAEQRRVASGGNGNADVGRGHDGRDRGKTERGRQRSQGAHSADGQGQGCRKGTQGGWHRRGDTEEAERRFLHKGDWKTADSGGQQRAWHCIRNTRTVAHGWCVAVEMVG